MNYNKTYILFILFAVLAILYAANIFLTKSLSTILVELPAKISFVIIQGPEDKCENCFDANTLTKTIDSAHNIKYKIKKISYSSPLSQRYIEKYDIQNLPAVVVSGDITNENVVSAWEALSGKEVNNSIVIENLLPYYDIETATVKGVISAILIKDTTCENCFDANEYINILGRFGIVVSNTVIYDIASKEGAALVEKYAITKVPTLILSQETSKYSSLVSSWGEVGTVEEDGWFVFREVQKLDSQYKEI